MAMVREEYAEPGVVRALAEQHRWGVIEEALEATGTATIRKRRFAGGAGGVAGAGLALYRDWSISRVVNHLHLALPGESGRGVVPSRVDPGAGHGWATSRLRLVFERCAQSWAHASADRHRLSRARSLTASTAPRCGHLIRQRIARTSEASRAATAERVATRRRGWSR